MLLPFYVFSGENNGIVRGTVTTADSKPAASVSVEIKNSTKGAITDDKGNFEIKKIKPGHYALSFSLLGYSDTSINVDIKPNEETFVNIQLRRTEAELKKITVEASASSKYTETRPSESLRLNLPLIEIPQNITVVTHQTLTDQGLLSTLEAIRNVSGIEKTYGGLNDYSLIIRGSDATYNVFRNGVGGYWWNQQEDIGMLEKIEFIKGPVGFMMSEAEPGGIVNISTKQPIREPLMNINAAFGSYNMKRLTSDFGGSLSKQSKFSYRFNAGIHYQDRAFQFSNALRYFVCGALKYDLDKKTSLTAEYNVMKAETKGNNIDLPSINGKLFVLPRNFAAADAGTDKASPSDNYYRIHFNHIFNDNWQLNVHLAYIKGSYTFHWLRADGTVPVSKDTIYRYANNEYWSNFSKVAQLFFEGKFTTTPKIEHKVLLGIDCYNAGSEDPWEDTQGEQKFGLYIPNPKYYVSQDSLKDTQFNLHYQKVRFNYATIYLQDHIKIGRRLVITLASHFTHATFYDTADFVPDYQKNNTYNVAVPRMGITWMFTKDISIYTMYDQSFWPQVGAVYKPTTLKPLTGNDLEAGLKSYFFEKKLNINFSVFDITKNNTLSGDPEHPGFNIQTGQIKSKGVDFDMTGNITPALIINANYEYADAKITKDSSGFAGLRVFGTPDHYGNLWLKYLVLHHKLKGLSFAIGYQYMGKRSAVDDGSWEPGNSINYLPAYNLFDAAIGYSNERFNINLNLYNLSNRNYAAVGYFNSGTNEWRYTPGEPINFRLSMGVSLAHHKKVDSNSRPD